VREICVARHGECEIIIRSTNENAAEYVQLWLTEAIYRFAIWRKGIDAQEILPSITPSNSDLT